MINSNLSLLNLTEKNANIAKVVLGVASLFAAAQISIPIKPVPITLHTLVLMAICLFYSPKLAHSTVLSYITMGLLGVPVFTNFNAGISYAIGPTGGYLLGFWLTSLIVPHLLEKYGRNSIQIFFSCIMAQAIIYIPGILWLSSFIGYEKAIYSGFIIYIPSGIIKIFLLMAMNRILIKA